MTYASFRTLFLFIGLSFVSAACTHGGRSAGAEASLSSGDRQFVTMAAQGSWAEIATGELARTNGGSESVRQFGQRMIQDHTAANKELATIAGRFGVTPPQGPDAKHQAEAQMMAKLKGAEFDRMYGAHMVKDHEMTVALFEKQSKGGDNAELRQFATKQLPILMEHLKMARALPQ